MRAADKVGAAIVATACVLAWRFGHLLPETTTLATVAWLGAAAAAAMRLTREIAVCLERRFWRTPSDMTLLDEELAHTTRRFSIGLLTVFTLSLLVAACLLGAVSVQLTPIRWTCIAVLILGTAFVAQDFHLTLRPFRLRHDPNHRRLARRQHA